MADRDRPQDDSDEDLDERQDEAQRELDMVPPHPDWQELGRPQDAVGRSRRHRAHAPLLQPRRSSCCGSRWRT